MNRRNRRNYNRMKFATVLLVILVISLLVNTFFLLEDKKENDYDVAKMMEGIDDSVEVEVLEEQQVINVANTLEVYTSAMVYRPKDNTLEWPAYLKPDKVVLDHYSNLVLMYYDANICDEDYAQLAADETTSFVEYIEVDDIKLETGIESNDYSGELSYAPSMLNSRAKAKELIAKGVKEHVTIGIVDTGLYSKNSDVVEYFDMRSSYDYVNGDANVFDGIDTHATYVASSLLDIIGDELAKENITLINGKALEDGTGTNYSLYLAVCGMADKGCDIINLSCGCNYADELIKFAINYATDKGVIVVCSAGNDGTGEKKYPAGFENTIAVSAIDSNQKLASFSNYGDNIDITAPGVNIIVDSIEGSMASVSGTSFSSPIISATIAMGKMENASINDKASAMNYLKSITVDLGTVGYDEYYGWGLPVFEVAKEEPTTREPETEQPTTREPETEQPETEEPTRREPETEEPTKREPETEEPTRREPETEEPTTKEPETEQPETEEPTTKEPTTEAPVSKSPSKILTKVTGIWNPGIKHLPTMYGRYAWDALEGAVSYEIYRADYKAGAYDNLDQLEWKYVGSTTINEFNDATIEYNHGYFIKVRGIDKDGNYGPWSNAIEIYNYQYNLDNLEYTIENGVFKVTFDSHPRAYGYEFQIKDKATGDYDIIYFYDTTGQVRLPKGEYSIGVLMLTQRLTEKGVVNNHGGTDFFDIVIE